MSLRTFLPSALLSASAVIFSTFSRSMDPLCQANGLVMGDMVVRAQRVVEDDWVVLT